jgi:hypothetical protein
VRLGRALAIAVVLLPAGSRAAASQSTAFTVSGNPSGPLTVTPPGDGTAGCVTSIRTTYSIAVQAASTTQISAQLSAVMPANTTMAVLLGVPPGATGVTSSGNVVLSTTPSTVISGFAQVNTLTGDIYYTFSATAAAGIIPATSRTVTFTVSKAP